MRTPEDDQEAKALADVAEHGCHVLLVREEGVLPPFAYSMGIQHSTAAPEVVVIGLRAEIAGWLVNEYLRRRREGAQFAEGAPQPDFLEGFAVRFHRVARAHYREYFGWNRWFYEGDEFDVVQLVYPSTAGVWPCDPAAPEAFRARQPLLYDCGCPAAWHDPHGHTATFVCEHVFARERPVLRVLHEHDGDWQVRCGGEHSDDDVPRLLGWNCVLERDASLREVRDLPLGYFAERASAGAPWQRRPLAVDNA